MTNKAAIVPAQGGAFEVRDVPIPEPKADQILVKSIYAPINPVDGYMIQWGILVSEWPLNPGCDAGGIVVKAGSEAVSALGKPFGKGDKVFGCTRLGTFGYATYQEYFLMDAKLAVPVPSNVSLVQASTLGVAAYTACLAIFEDLNVPIPSVKSLPEPKDEWALVLGGASAVGKAAFQILKACGYKVIVTASPSSSDVLKTLGVDATVSYKQSQEDVISEIVQKTDGKLYRVFDAVAQNIAFSVPLFKALGEGEKWFSSTNDWDPLPTLESVYFGCTRLGKIGDPEAVELNKQIESYIPLIYDLVELGKLQASEYEIIGSIGVDSVAEVYAYQQAGKGGNKKVIVQIAAE